MKNPEDNLITIVTNKEITRLYKTLLEMVEDLKKDHEIMLDKIKEKTNEDFTNSINYFTQAKYDQIRKRILDVGNECDRNLINFLGYFDSAINVKKVEEAAQQKAVYKKTIISQPVII